MTPTEQEIEALKRLYGAAIGNDAYPSSTWGEDATADYVRLRHTLARLEAEIERLRKVMALHSMALHPHYGGCDEMGDGGLCAECERLGHYQQQTVGDDLTRELAEALRLLADDHEHGATGTMRQGHLRQAREAFARYDALGGAEAHQGTLYWHTDPMHPCPTCGHHLEAPDDSE